LLQFYEAFIQRSFLLRGPARIVRFSTKPLLPSFVLSEEARHELLVGFVWRWDTLDDGFR